MTTGMSSIAPAARLRRRATTPPEYKHPKKHWRVKQGAMPQWYKARSGVRTKALSGAARVARFRPQKFN